MPDRREQGRGTAKGGGLGPPPGATEPERGLETGGAEGAGEQGVLEVGWVSDDLSGKRCRGGVRDDGPSPGHHREDFRWWRPGSQ